VGLEVKSGKAGPVIFVQALRFTTSNPVNVAALRRVSISFIVALSIVIVDY
jgi:hypothetical protein